MNGVSRTDFFSTGDVASGPNAVCFIMKTTDDMGKKGEFLILPFFPESLSDTKAVNWDSMELPGGSHPLYQFVSGGERTFSFVAKLLRETKPISGYNNIDGPIDRRSPFNIDINKAVRFLRSCMYPRYEKSTVRSAPICKVKIGGTNFDKKSNGLINCFMTQCDVEVTKWWDDAKTTPRVAEVSLAFTEIINVFNSVEYTSSDNVTKG